jgi:hypothetical protein
MRAAFFVLDIDQFRPLVTTQRTMRPNGESDFSGLMSPICIAMTERRSVAIPNKRS